MLTKNLDVARGLVNGARGVVVAFESGRHGNLKRMLYLFINAVIHFHCLYLLEDNFKLLHKGSFEILGNVPHSCSY